MEESAGNFGEEKLSSSCGEPSLHKSKGKTDNPGHNFQEGQDFPTQENPIHKTVSTASENIPCPMQTPAVRETVSCSRMASRGEPEPEPEEEGFQEALQSFVKAVHKKYTDTELEDLPNAIEHVVLVPKKGPVKMTASGNIVLPRQVSMSGCEISVAGDPALIQRMCQKVRELDLMENNLTCWDEVFYIIECIPHLTFLNLTKNHLTSDLPELTGWKLPNLNYLVINDTMISWDTLLRLLEAFPNIEELHLSLNGFETVDIPSTVSPATSSLISWSSTNSIKSYPTLRKLFFIGNKVTNWQEMNKLGAFFPNLEFLLLSETDLQTLDGADEVADCFPNLQMLGLNRTLLGSWEEIEKLRLFPSLTDVRLNAIPFLEEFPEQFRRHHIIAILPNITTLNGSPVKDSEREDAERAYLRLYMDKPDKPKRYEELERQHGKLNPLVKVELKPKKQVKVKVRLESPNKQLIRAEDMDIEVSQTIRDLKKNLSNVAGCSAAKFQLFYLDMASNFGLDRLQYMDRKVFSYNMQDGDEIIIALKE